MKKLYLFLMIFGLIGLDFVVQGANQGNQSDVDSALRRLGMERYGSREELIIKKERLINRSKQDFEMNLRVTQDGLRLRLNAALNDPAVPANIKEFIRDVQSKNHDPKKTNHNYRKLAVEFHPDKTIGQADDIRKKAEANFKVLAMVKEVFDAKIAEQSQSNADNQKRFDEIKQGIEDDAKIINDFWDKSPHWEGGINDLESCQSCFRKGSQYALIPQIVMSWLLRGAPKMHVAAILTASLAASGARVLAVGKFQKDTVVGAIIPVLFAHMGCTALAISGAHINLWYTGLRILSRKKIIDSQTRQELKPDSEL